MKRLTFTCLLITCTLVTACSTQEASTSIQPSALQNIEVNNDCQGACSHHDGINCTAGPGLNGQVLCADGWAGSSVSYQSCCG